MWRGSHGVDLGLDGALYSTVHLEGAQLPSHTICSSLPQTVSVWELCGKDNPVPHGGYFLDVQAHSAVRRITSGPPGSPTPS